MGTRTLWLKHESDLRREKLQNDHAKTANTHWSAKELRAGWMLRMWPGHPAVGQGHSFLSSSIILLLTKSRDPGKSPGPAVDTLRPLQLSQYRCWVAREQEGLGTDFVLLSNDVHPSKPKHHLSSAAAEDRLAGPLLPARVLQTAAPQTQIVWLYPVCSFLSFLLWLYFGCCFLWLKFNMSNFLSQTAIRILPCVWL